MSDDEASGQPAKRRGGPYKQTDVRHGPPLPYLAEKIETAIEQSWFILKSIDLIPKDIPLPPNFPASVNIRADFVEAPAHHILSDSLKAWLGLYDLLEWWHPDLADELVRGSRADLKAFISKVWNEGDPSGRTWPTGADLEKP